MAEALPKVDRAFLSVLVRGAEKTFDNAEKLYFEAELLAKAGATARALCLHQISLEECSKIENMGAWAISLLSDLKVDQNKILASFRRHSSKNKSNAYMLEGSQAEQDAKARGDCASFMKPSLDQVAHAGGAPASPSYNKDGAFILRR
jgi:AbiV family abortive infection protein